MSGKPYSPSHVVKALEITAYDLRTWRDSLPPFNKVATQQGKDIGIAYGELVGFAVVEMLRKRIGVNLQLIAQISQVLFDHCMSTNYSQLMQQKLLLEIHINQSELKANLIFIGLKDRHRNEGREDAVVIISRMAEVIQRVDIALERLGFLPSAQRNLAFPPQLVAGSSALEQVGRIK